MGKLYRYNYIREGLSVPKILSFRLTIEIPEHLCDQLQEFLDPDEPPTSCFISQIYAKKMGNSHCLVITVNLLSLYEKWSTRNDDYDYKSIIYLLREKINDRFGKVFTESFICHEKLVCDFIEYAFLAEGRGIITGMAECHANSNQYNKIYWDDYLEPYKSKIKIINDAERRYNKEHKDSKRTPYTSFMLGIETHEYEVDNEVYVRCYAPQLQEFFLNLEKTDYISGRGVLLKALYDDNLKKTICQCAYEHNCLRYCPDSKLIYEEYCKEFGNPLESQTDVEYPEFK